MTTDCKCIAGVQSFVARKVGRFLSGPMVVVVVVLCAAILHARVASATRLEPPAYSCVTKGEVEIPTARLVLHPYPSSQPSADTWRSDPDWRPLHDFLLAFRDSPRLKSRLQKQQRINRGYLAPELAAWLWNLLMIGNADSKEACNALTIQNSALLELPSRPGWYPSAFDPYIVPIYYRGKGAAMNWHVDPSEITQGGLEQHGTGLGPECKNLAKFVLYFGNYTQPGGTFQTQQQNLTLWPPPGSAILFDLSERHRSLPLIGENEEKYAVGLRVIYCPFLVYK